MEPAPFLPGWPGIQVTDAGLEIYVKFGGGLGFGKDPEGCQTPTETKNNGVRREPGRNPPTHHRRDGEGSPTKTGVRLCLPEWRRLRCY